MGRMSRFHGTFYGNVYGSRTDLHSLIVVRDKNGILMYTVQGQTLIECCGKKVPILMYMVQGQTYFDCAR